MCVCYHSTQRERSMEGYTRAITQHYGSSGRRAITQHYGSSGRSTKQSSQALTSTAKHRESDSPDSSTAELTHMMMDGGMARVRKGDRGLQGRER